MKCVICKKEVKKNFPRQSTCLEYKCHMELKKINRKKSNARRKSFQKLKEKLSRECFSK